jgi:catechol-2,3-dioxygenase
LSEVKRSSDFTNSPIHLTPFPFDERRIGLDHLAFTCRDRDELEAWQIRLSELGIDNGGIVDADYGSGLSCRDPDNIALEFFTPAF